MPVADYALTTRDDVRAYLQKNAPDTNQDTLTDDLVDAASWAIIRRYGKFGPAETAAAKVFVWDGSRRLKLFPYFLRSVTSIVLDTDTSSTTTLATTDYSLRPTTPLDGVYRWLRLPNHQVEVGLERQITITGNWGYSAIPTDVAQAAIVTVAEWLRRGVQAFGQDFGISDSGAEPPAALPMAAVRLLRDFHRPGQG